MCLFQTYKTETITYDARVAHDFFNAPVVSIAEAKGAVRGRRVTIEGVITQVSFIVFY